MDPGEVTQVSARLAAEGSGKGRLFVKTMPEGAQVRILNIGPRFHQGMELDAGRYHVEVSAPVGSFMQNAFGLYDMLGNVWAWIEDGYDKSAYSSHSRSNPVNTGGSGRVIRGGSWRGDPWGVRCANRRRYSPGLRRRREGRSGARRQAGDIMVEGPAR